jgi:hypothetical protein
LLSLWSCLEGRKEGRKGRQQGRIEGRKRTRQDRTGQERRAESKAGRKECKRDIKEGRNKGTMDGRHVRFGGRGAVAAASGIEDGGATLAIANVSAAGII